MNTNHTSLELAQKLHQQGRTADALETLDNILLQSPHEIAAIQFKCIILVQSGDLTHAKQLLQQAVKENPKEPSLYNSLGNIAQREQDYALAVDAYQHALKLNPNYPGALNNLGNAYLALKQLALAEQSYRKAIRVDSLYPDAHFNLARLHVQNGHLRSSLAHLEKVIKIVPQHAGAQGLLANVLLQLGDFKNAVEHLKAKLSIQPQHAQTHQALGNAYLKLKQHRLAIEHLTLALKINPELEEAEFHLANAYLAYGNRERALQHYLRQLEHAQSGQVHYNLGVIYSDLQRHSDALRHFTEALAYDPNHLATHLNIAAVYLNSGETKKAIIHYQKAKMLDPSNEEIKHILHALQQDSNPDSAPTAYSKNLFDHYAIGYDKHLIETLQYSVPQQIHHAIMTELNPKDYSLRIVDLGCGTGLIAEQFEYQAKELIGIDISANMLEKAKNKNLYHQLINQPIQQALNAFRNIDLIIAADVFPYLGDLQEVFAQAKQALQPNGYFIFSIEKTSAPTYQLQKNIRYAHSINFIRKLSNSHGFEIISEFNSILRKQKNKPVEGVLFLLKSKN